MRTRATLIGLAFLITLFCTAYGGQLEPLSRILYGPAEDVAVYGSHVLATKGSYIVVFDDGMEVINDLDLGSKIRAIIVEGSWCYAALENGEVLAVNLSTTPNLSIGARLEVSANITNMAASGGLLYAAAFEGIHVINITRAPTLSLIRTLRAEGQHYISVEAFGSFVLAGRNSRFIDVFSSSGSLVGEVVTLGRAIDQIVRGSRLYVLDNWSHLSVYDISDPTSPDFIGRTTVSNPANRIFERNEIIYVASATGRVTAYDVSLDGEPRAMGHFSGGQIFYGMGWKDGFLYTAAYFGGLYRIDVRSPYDLRERGRFDQSGYSHAVEFRGDYAYIAHGPGGLFVADISDINNPVIVDRRVLGYVSDLIAWGDYLYVLDETGTIYVYNIISGIPSPTIALPLSTSRICGMEIKTGLDGNDYLYTMEFNRKIIVININDPALPRIIWETPMHFTPGFNLNQVWNFLSVTTSTGFQLYDNLFFPAEPRWYNHFTVDGIINDIAAVDSTCIVATEDNGAFVLTLGHRVPMAGTPVHIDHFSKVKGVTAIGNYAILASADDGIAIYDVERYENPLRIDNVKFSGALNVNIDGESGLVAASRGHSGVSFLSAKTIIETCIHFQRGWNTISLPINPEDATLGSGIPSTIVGAFTYDPVTRHYSGPVTELEPGVGYFFFSETDTVVILEGEEIDPLTVDLVPGWNLIGTGSKRVNASSLIGRSSLLAQFFRYDPKACSYIEEEYTLATDGGYWVLALDYITLNLVNGNISLGKASTGTPYSRSDFPPYPPALPGESIEVKQQQTAVIEISGNPNPFNAATTVRINLPNDGPVKASVYDVSGRIIETIMDKTVAAGEHSVTWSPAYLVRSGVYILRVETDYGSATQKLLLAK